jgi:hypothetical protein
MWLKRLKAISFAEKMIYRWLGGWHETTICGKYSQNSFLNYAFVRFASNAKHTL